MGTLFSTFDIARSGLQAAQVQIDVAAHNIANVNTEGYSRQRALLSARWPIDSPFGQIGRGVEVDGIERIRDTFLDVVYRQQAPNLASTEIQAQYYTRIQDLFLEPGENGFGTRLNDLFDAFNDFANNPESMPARESVIAQSQAIAGSLREVSGRLYTLRTNANEQIIDLVPEINLIGQQIASLNDAVRIAEAGGNTAGDLRDQRDRLLDELAGYVNVLTREREDGQVDVLIGDDEFVNGTITNELVAVPNSTLDPERGDLVELRFRETNHLVDVRSGQIFGLLTIRDSVLPEVDGRIDEIAGSLIEQINRVHSQGRGRENLSGLISGTNAVSDPATALGAAGLPFSVSPGTFDVVVYDAAGNATTTTVTVTGATTLNSLAADLNGIANFSATVNADGTLSLGASPGLTFGFANDTSGALTALGVNGLFTGHDARTIGVNQDIVDDPALLSSRFGLDPLNTGDASAALAMADVRNGHFMEGGTATVNDYYEGTVARLGVSARANLQIREVEQGFVDDFQRRRLETSGVSIDEEVSFLMQFERAFEASARVMSVVDRMLETLLNATQ